MNFHPYGALYEYTKGLSATLAPGRHHIGLAGQNGALALQLKHTQVIIFHRHATRRAFHGMPVLDVADQEDDVVVAARAYRESAGPFAVIDLGRGRFEEVFPQGHDHGLYSALFGARRAVLIRSGCPLCPFHFPDAEYCLQRFQQQNGPVLGFFMLCSY